MARTLQLDESLFHALLEQAGVPRTLVGFSSSLRAAMKGAEVLPIAGLDLPRSLEAIMKVAKHLLEFTPPLRARTLEGDLDAARERAEAVVATGVWLRSLNAPEWLYGFLEAGDAFLLLAAAAASHDEPRTALHWMVAALLSPATLLSDGTGGALRMTQADVARLIALQRTLGTEATEEEMESWHDLYGGYRLLRPA
jgi:hypothetical protein